jgi:hypothetical protein
MSMILNCSSIRKKRGTKNMVFDEAITASLSSKTLSQSLCFTSSLDSIDTTNKSKYHVQIREKHMKKNELSGYELCRQKSTSTIDSRMSESSQGSISYVLDLKHPQKSWSVTNENIDMNNYKLLDLSHKTSVWKMRNSKRHHKMEPLEAIVMVSSACMPRQSNINDLETLDLEKSYLQLTAFGEVTAIVLD